MPLDYETCKRLEKAGFKQAGMGTYIPKITSIDVGAYGNPTYTPSTDVSEKIYEPTLSELVEACRKKDLLFSLDETVDGWEAYRQNTEYQMVGVKGSGDTPELAVANLYLLIHTPSKH